MIQAMLADMDAGTEAARQLLYKACVEIEAGSPDAGPMVGHVQTRRRRHGDARHDRRRPGPRRLRLHRRVPGRADDARREDHPALRGNAADPAPGHRPGAGRARCADCGRPRRDRRPRRWPARADRRPRRSRSRIPPRAPSAWGRTGGSTARRRRPWSTATTSTRSRRRSSSSRRTAARSRSCRWRRRTAPRRCARPSRWAPRAGSSSPTRRSRAPTRCRRRASWRRRSRTSSSTCSSPASTRPTARAGVVPAGVAARLGLPYLSYAAKIEPDPAAGPGPRPPAVREGLRRPRGADAGARRRARRRSARRATRRSRGSWPRGRRRSRTQSLAELGGARTAGRRRAGTTKVSPRSRRRRRAADGSCADAADEAAPEVVDFLAERRII